MLKFGLFIEQFHCERELRGMTYKLELSKINRPTDNRHSSKEFRIAQLPDTLETYKALSEIELNQDLKENIFKIESIDNEKLILSKDVKINHKQMNEINSVKIKLRLNPYPFSCCHFVLDNLDQETIKNRLNPTKFEPDNLSNYHVEINDWINKQINNNTKKTSHKKYHQ